MEEKKFGPVDITLLVMIALFNDFLEVMGDFSLAIPVVGEVIAGSIAVVNFFIWGIILFWFIMKTGAFGAVGTVQIAGGIIQFFGIPGRTATVLIGIYLANHPKTAAVAQVAAGKLAGAGKGVAAVGEEAAAAGKAAAAESRTGASGAVRAGAGERADGTITREDGSGETSEPPAEEGKGGRVLQFPERQISPEIAEEEGEKKPEVPPEALGEEPPLLGESGKLEKELITEPSMAPPPKQKEKGGVEVNDSEGSVDLRKAA